MVLAGATNKIHSQKLRQKKKNDRITKYKLGGNTKMLNSNFERKESSYSRMTSRINTASSSFNVGLIGLRRKTTVNEK